MTAKRLTSFLLMVIVFSPITDIFSDALWGDNITDAQQKMRVPIYKRRDRDYDKVKTITRES
ncbi:hypothetical protein CLV97_1339 [Planifilum fimeticola]|uniref:Uncharacterized protein n=1 Tax=Planifilum fimeticola TaxID=201975 RepID=A0A2T0LAP6_9BACL|nr:hypothetical protein CLV97_1339 [Planifilum fimeticola]